MTDKNRNNFESEEFLLRIDPDHFLYAEKSEVLFDFGTIARLRIHRRKTDGKVCKITYRVKGQLTSFQIDGFTDADMQRIAAQLTARARSRSVPITDPGA